MWVTEYDPVDQLLGVTVRSNTVAGAILKQFVYGYDKSGNRTREQIYSGGASTSVTSASHNTANQLTDVAAGGSTRFKGSLNELGTVTVAGSAATVDSRTTNFVGYASTTSGTNTVPVVATDYSNNSRTNNYQIVVTNNGVAKTLTYDQNGNLSSVVTATSTNTYEWDAADRLVAINMGTNRSEFTYDGSGRRTQIVEKQNGSVVSTKKFLWCGTELCEERDSTGATVSKRFFGQGEQISGTNYCFTADHLGSVREMTDSSGAIRARYEYDPYGRRAKVSGDLDADFAYTGHYYHANSGFYLAPFRAYDPDTGRWISRDPISEVGGLNLYAYVGSDPVNKVDPLGLDWEWAWNWHHEIPKRFQSLLKFWGIDLDLHSPDNGYMLRGRDHIGPNGIHNVNDGAFDDEWDNFMSKPKTKQQILDFKAQMKETYADFYSKGYKATEPYSGPMGKAGKVLKGLGVIAFAFELLNAKASAAEIFGDVQMFYQDCQAGKYDWAYVDLLVMRHDLNQHALFSGDVAMHGMLKLMD